MEPTDLFHTAEHSHHGQTLMDVKCLIEHGSFVQAAKRFAEFLRWLELHFQWEEQVLLPVFIRRTGDPLRLVPRILAEHNQLLQVINNAAAALSQWNCEAFMHEMQNLEVLLSSHHDVEERFLAPVLGDITAFEEVSVVPTVAFRQEFGSR
jgi:hypothetical protein